MIVQLTRRLALFPMLFLVFVLAACSGKDEAPSDRNIDDMDPQPEVLLEPDQDPGPAPMPGVDPGPGVEPDPMPGMGPEPMPGVDPDPEMGPDPMPGVDPEPDPMPNMEPDPNPGPGDPGGECDPFLQDCPENEGGDPQQCNPISGEPTCQRENNVQRVEDEECSGGDCAPGMTCITWSDGRGQICTKMCPAGDSSFCPEDKECGAFIRSNPEIGLCRPGRQVCDIYAQDCEEGFACTFGRDADTNDPIFVCEAAGPNGPGDACSNGNGRCGAGMVCIRDDENSSTCHEICEVDEDCTFDEQTCSARSNTWQVTFCR